MSSFWKQSALSPLAQGVLKGGIFFLTLTLVACLLRFADASGLFDASFLNEYIKDQGTTGVVLFLGIAVVFSAIGMPRQLMSIAAGYAFGVFLGTFFMGLALVGGGLLSFYYARLLARSTIQRRFAKKVAVIERVWLAKPFLLTVCLRLLPVGNNALLNLLAGTSRVHPLPFFCGSFVGYIPQNLIFTLLGSGIGFDDTEKFLYSGLLFLVSVGLGLTVYRSLRNQGADLVLTGRDIPVAYDEAGVVGNCAQADKVKKEDGLEEASGLNGFDASCVGGGGGKSGDASRFGTPDDASRFGKSGDVTKTDNLVKADKYVGPDTLARPVELARTNMHAEEPGRAGEVARSTVAQGTGGAEKIDEAEKIGNSGENDAVSSLSGLKKLDG